MTILPNNVAVIDGCSHHGIWCAAEGLIHDRFTSRLLREAIKQYEVKVCVDAGAHIGSLARVMLDEGCKVHAFEPNPAAIECLRHNCPEAIIHGYALSDQEGSVAYHSNINSGAGHCEVNDCPMITGGDLPMTTLDRFNIPAGLVKIDIEGFEVRMLKGARKTIHDYAPVILFEVNKGALERAGSSDKELFQLIHELGYDISILQPGLRFGDPQYDVIARPT